MIDDRKKETYTSIYNDGTLPFQVIDKVSVGGGAFSEKIASPQTENGVKSFGIKVANGGTLVQLVKNGVSKNSQVGGGLRNAISSFSNASRNNLLRWLFSLDRTLLLGDDVLFITLTYDGDTEKNKWIRGTEYKRHLKNITQAIQRKYGGFGIWKFELQRRLVGHFHLVWFRTKYISHHWLSSRWNEITNGSLEHLKAGVQVERARSWKGVQLYGSKVMGYVAKEETVLSKIKHMAKISMGRCWGISNREMFNSFIRIMYMELTEKMHSVLTRLYGNMQKSWKRQIGNYKGWKSLKTWMRSWNWVGNLCINIFMENKVILKLLKWVEMEYGALRFGMHTRKEKKRDKKYNKLDMWRMDNRLGLYEGIV